MPIGENTMGPVPDAISKTKNGNQFHGFKKKLSNALSVRYSRRGVFLNVNSDGGIPKGLIATSLLDHLHVLQFVDI